MYEVNYCGPQKSCASKYFDSHIQPEGLLCDAERDLLATAKFFCHFQPLPSCEQHVAISDTVELKLRTNKNIGLRKLWHAGTKTKITKTTNH